MPFPFPEEFANTALAPKESSGGGGYLNPSKIEDGSSARFCILSEQPLVGYEVWFTKYDNSMTKRITPQEPDAALLAELEADIGAKVTERDGRKSIKACTCFFVYDYADESVKVFSSNQKTLQADIMRLTSDPDYDDLSKWDMKIARSGKLTDTKYTVMMVPTKRSDTKVAKAVIQAWDAACAAGADIEALYEGGNPFGAR